MSDEKPYTRAEVESEAWFGGQKERVLATVEALQYEQHYFGELLRDFEVEKGKSAALRLDADEKWGASATERDALKAELEEMRPYVGPRCLDPRCEDYDGNHPYHSHAGEKTWTEVQDCWQGRSDKIPGVVEWRRQMEQLRAERDATQALLEATQTERATAIEQAAGLETELLDLEAEHKTERERRMTVTAERDALAKRVEELEAEKGRRGWAVERWEAELSAARAEAAAQYAARGQEIRRHEQLERAHRDAMQFAWTRLKAELPSGKLQGVLNETFDLARKALVAKETPVTYTEAEMQDALARQREACAKSLEMMSCLCFARVEATPLVAPRVEAVPKHITHEFGRDCPACIAETKVAIDAERAPRVEAAPKTDRRESLRAKLNAGPYAGRAPVTDAELSTIEAEADRMMRSIKESAPVEPSITDAELSRQIAEAMERSRQLVKDALKLGRSMSGISESDFRLVLR